MKIKVTAKYITHLHYYVFWGYGILLTPLNTNMHTYIHTYNGKVLSYSLIIGCNLSNRANASETSRLLRHSSVTN